MAELPSEIQRARRLLQAVAVPPGVRERIYANITSPRCRTRHKLLGPALVTAAVLVATGAAALSLGVIELPSPFEAPQAVPADAPGATHTPKRSVGRAGRHRSDPQPARPTASPNRPFPPAAPLSERQEAAASSFRAPLAPEPRCVSRNAARQQQEAPVMPGRSSLLVRAFTAWGARTSSKDRSTTRNGAPEANGRSSHGCVSSAAASELAQQVKAYRRAVTLIPDQPARALGELRAFRSQWPGSALAHEVDLRIVQTLLALGSRAELFVARHPGSPRVAEMRTLAGEANRADGRLR